MAVLLLIWHIGRLRDHRSQHRYQLLAEHDQHSGLDHDHAGRHCRLESLSRRHLWRDGILVRRRQGHHDHRIAYPRVYPHGRWRAKSRPTRFPLLGRPGCSQGLHRRGHWWTVYSLPICLGVLRLLVLFRTGADRLYIWRDDQPAQEPPDRSSALLLPTHHILCPGSSGYWGNLQLGRPKPDVRHRRRERISVGHRHQERRHHGLTFDYQRWYSHQCLVRGQFLPLHVESFLILPRRFRERTEDLHTMPQERTAYLRGHCQ